MCQWEYQIILQHCCKCTQNVYLKNCIRFTFVCTVTHTDIFVFFLVCHLPCSVPLTCCCRHPWASCLLHPFFLVCHLPCSVPLPCCFRHPWASCLLHPFFLVCHLPCSVPLTCCCRHPWASCLLHPFFLVCHLPCSVPLTCCCRHPWASCLLHPFFLVCHLPCSVPLPCCFRHPWASCLLFHLALPHLRCPGVLHRTRRPQAPCHHSPRPHPRQLNRPALCRSCSKYCSEPFLLEGSFALKSKFISNIQQNMPTFRVASKTVHLQHILQFCFCFVVHFVVQKLSVPPQREGNSKGWGSRRQIFPLRIPSVNGICEGQGCPKENSFCG